MHRGRAPDPGECRAILAAPVRSESRWLSEDLRPESVSGVTGDREATSAETSGPEDRVYIVGSEPQIFFYAERASATRYIFFYPLTGDYPDVLERQREVAAEVALARPRYVVWVESSRRLLLPQSWMHSNRTSFDAREEHCSTGTIGSSSSPIPSSAARGATNSSTAVEARQRTGARVRDRERSRRRGSRSHRRRRALIGRGDTAPWFR